MKLKRKNNFLSNENNCLKCTLFLKRLFPPTYCLHDYLSSHDFLTVWNKTDFVLCSCYLCHIFLVLGGCLKIFCYMWIELRLGNDIKNSLKIKSWCFNIHSNGSSLKIWHMRLLHTDFRKIGYKQVAVFLGMSAL